jgi:hypothetical protein
LLAVAVPSYGEATQAPRRDEMYAAIRGYAAAVAVADWQHMQAGSSRSGSARKFERLASAFLDARQLNEAHQARLSRISKVAVIGAP